jgi:hypothetical protein
MKGLALLIRRARHPVSIAASVALAGLAVAVLAGCTGATTESPPDAQASASSATPAAAGSTSFEQQLRDRAEANGIADPPPVAVIRVVSQQDWPQTNVDCMTAAGFDAKLTADGQGSSWEAGPDQAEAAQLADYVCFAQYPVDPSQMGELSDAQKEIVYTYVSETLVPCLEAEGYETTGMPSRETFLAGFDLSPPWNPYTTVYATITSIAESERITAACPPNTPPELIYGE